MTEQETPGTTVVDVNVEQGTEDAPHTEPPAPEQGDKGSDAEEPEGGDAEQPDADKGDGA